MCWSSWDHFLSEWPVRNPPSPSRMPAGPAGSGCTSSATSPRTPQHVGQQRRLTGNRLVLDPQPFARQSPAPSRATGARASLQRAEALFISWTGDPRARQLLRACCEGPWVFTASSWRLRPQSNGSQVTWTPTVAMLRRQHVDVEVGTCGAKRDADVRKATAFVKPAADLGLLQCELRFAHVGTARERVPLRGVEVESKRRDRGHASRLRRPNARPARAADSTVPSAKPACSGASTCASSSCARRDCTSSASDRSATFCTSRSCTVRSSSRYSATASPPAASALSGLQDREVDPLDVVDEGELLLAGALTLDDPPTPHFPSRARLTSWVRGRRHLRGHVDTPAAAAR